MPCDARLNSYRQKVSFHKKDVSLILQQDVSLIFAKDTKTYVIDASPKKLMVIH